MVIRIAMKDRDARIRLSKTARHREDLAIRQEVSIVCTVQGEDDHFWCKQLVASEPNKDNNAILQD